MLLSIEKLIYGGEGLARTPGADGRSMAVLVIVAVLAFWWQSRTANGSRTRTARHGMVAALALQVALGIATVLSAVALPLAAAHQACAVVLFACVLRSAFLVRTQGGAPAVN